MQEKFSRALSNRLVRISAYSMIMVVCTYLGLYLGLYIDKLTGMSPNFTLVCLICGIALGFHGFIQETLLRGKE